MKIITCIVVLLILAGCSTEVKDNVDMQVLCDPNTGQGYLIRHNVGSTYFISRVSYSDKICGDLK